MQLILNSRRKAYGNNAKEVYILLSGKIKCGKGGSYGAGRRVFNSCGETYILCFAMEKKKRN